MTMCGETKAKARNINGHAKEMISIEENWRVAACHLYVLVGFRSTPITDDMYYHQINPKNIQQETIAITYWP